MRSRFFDTRGKGRKAQTSHSLVVNEMGRAIVAGVFPVGSILPGDSELVSRFKVSRTVLRESMKTLAAKGLVVPRARVGTKVTDQKHWNMFDSEVLTWHFENGVDREFLLHLYDVRFAFEPLAARLAAERAQPDDIQILDRLAREMAGLDHTQDSLALADLRFHLAIAEASHNPFMRTLESLIEAALVGMFRMSTPPSKNGFGDISEKHLRIVDAIVARDATAAQKAMEFVIIEGRDHVIEAFAALEDG